MRTQWKLLVSAAAFVLLPLAAAARPLLIPPKHLALPLPGNPPFVNAWDPSYYSVAIDGDTVLASAQRVVNTNGDRVNGVYIFQRNANGAWKFAGVLTEGSQYLEQVWLDGDVAVVAPFPGFRVYERTAAGWNLSATFNINQTMVRVEDGSIYTRPYAPNSTECLPPYSQYQKVNSTWQVVATIGGARCEYDYLDINDGLALIASTPNTFVPQQPPQIFRNVNGAWPQVASIPTLPPEPNRLPYLTQNSLNATLAYLSPGYLYRNAGNDNWVSAGRLVHPEQDLNVVGGTPVLRGNNLFLSGSERDYELPSHDIDVNLDWRTLRVYRPPGNGSSGYFARLNPDFDMGIWSVSDDGRRVVGAAATDNGGYSEFSKLYVFEIPDTARFPESFDNFEAGNFARWTSNAGQFSVVQNGATRVLRQSSLTGDAGATLTAYDRRDQAIEADVRPLEFAGTGRWFGLVTRRTDASNYYYVTFRQPSTISLRMVRQGVVSELGYAFAPEPFVAGRSYRVRLESVGDQHVAFLDGLPRVFVKDTRLAHGTPGVAGYRTRFDVDNVIVTGGTRMLTMHDSMETFFNGQAYYKPGAGTWVPIAIDEEPDSFHSYLRQTDTSGTARVFTRTSIANQVVSARMQPLSYGATTGDPWFGIAARVVNDDNYLYLTARRSNQLSLRKVVNGAVQTIANVPLTVATNRWYDLRLEVFGTTIRAYVNGDLKIETSDPGVANSGRSGVLMYRTQADLWSFITYQP